MHKNDDKKQGIFSFCRWGKGEADFFNAGSGGGKSECGIFRVCQLAFLAVRTAARRSGA